MLPDTFLAVWLLILCAVGVWHCLPQTDESHAPHAMDCLRPTARGFDPDIALDWTVELADGDQASDLTDARLVLEQVG